MLVCGVQGCGKSLVSKAAAKVLGLPLVRLDFADVFAAEVPEHALREALRVTEAIAPVVLWVDEIEKGLGGTALGGEEVRVFGAFLTWLQERKAPVFVAATANEVDRLPPELARRGRFDEVFFVDHVARRGPPPTTLGLANVVKDTEQFSGAELEQVVTSALFRAYAAKRDLTEADLRAAARDVVPLATLYEEKIQALRAWGAQRARRASADRRTLELFDGG
jgi:SpoVK/Ycf46/Vps4 family AAA+-type ATPase